jgi:hypothetical protein
LAAPPLVPGKAVMVRKFDPVGIDALTTPGLVLTAE